MIFQNFPTLQKESNLCINYVLDTKAEMYELNI